eukprot:IDg1766t1
MQAGNLSEQEQFADSDEPQTAPQAAPQTETPGATSASASSDHETESNTGASSLASIDPSLESLKTSLSEIQTAIHYAERMNDTRKYYGLMDVYARHMESLGVPAVDTEANPVEDNAPVPNNPQDGMSETDNGMEVDNS